MLDLEADPAARRAAVNRRTQPPGLGIGDAVALPFLFVALLVALRIAAGQAARALGLGWDGLTPLLLAQVVAGPVVLALAVRWSGMSLTDAFRIRGFPLRILPALMVAALGLTALVARLTLLLPQSAVYRERVAEGLGQSAPLVALLSAVVAAPVVEELLCRGVLLRGLLRRHSAWTAALLTALVFAVFHLNPTQGLIALPMGLGLAWLALRTGSVVPGIVAHAVVNGSSVVGVIFLLARGYTARQLAAATAAPAWLLAATAAATVLAAGVLWWQLRDYVPEAGAAGRAAAAAGLPRSSETPDAPVSPEAGVAPDGGPIILRPALVASAALVIFFMLPRQLLFLSTNALLVPETGPPTPNVLRLAGCYAIDMPPAEAARLFLGAGPGPVGLRLTTVRYRLGNEHPSRYLVRPLGTVAALPPARDSEPVYWIARDAGGLSIVAGRTLLVLRPSGRDFVGSISSYDSIGGAPRGTTYAAARRIFCPDEVVRSPR